MIKGTSPKNGPARRARVVSISRFPKQTFRKKLVARDIVRRPLLGDVSVVHLFLPPNTALPRILHRRTMEVIYCVDGAMVAYLGSKKFRLVRGSVIYIPPGVWHKFVTQSRSCEALALFHPQLLIERGEDIHAEPGVSLWD